jgi:hypothetical protein
MIIFFRLRCQIFSRLKTFSLLQEQFFLLYPEPDADGFEWCKKLEFQISLVDARLIVPLAVEIAPYLYLNPRESCIRQGAKEADVMVLPMDMCDYDAHSGNFRNPFLAEFCPVRLSSRDT